MKRISLYALLLASVYTPEVYARIDKVQAVGISPDQEDLLKRFKGNSKQEALVDPYATFLQLIATSGTSLYEKSARRVDNKPWFVSSISQELPLTIAKISSKRLTSGTGFVFENHGSEDQHLTPELIHDVSTSSILTDWELMKEPTQLSSLDIREEEQSASQQDQAQEGSLTLDIEERELLEIFEQALFRLQSKLKIKGQEILDTVLEVLLETPLLNTPNTASKTSYALDGVLSENPKGESLTPDLTSTAKFIAPGNSETTEKAIVTSGNGSETEVFSTGIPIPPVPPVLPKLMFSQKTEKRILSIADIINQSLGKVQLRRSVSSKNNQEEETFNLGAMGTISGKEASLLARRMAKLREEAEKNARVSYASEEKPRSNTQTGTTKAPLTWKKTGPAKIVLKKITPVNGKPLSLAEALAGGIKLRATTQNTNKTISQDPKDALKKALESAFKGGLKLRSVQERISQEKREDQSPGFGLKLKSVQRTGSVNNKKEENFFSQNPILKKLREKALRQEQEEQRRLEEETRTQKLETSGETNVLKTPSVNAPSETMVVEQQHKSPEVVVIPVTPTVTPVQEKKEEPKSGSGDIMSTLFSFMSKFNFDEEDDGQTSSDWDEEEDEFSSTTSFSTTVPHKQEEIIVPPKQQPIVGRLKVIPAKEGMNLLEQIRSRGRIESSVDEERIQKLVEKEKELKVAQEKLLKQQEEERRLRERQVSYKIEVAKREQMTNDLLKNLANRRAFIDSNDDEDDDDDWDF